MSRKHRNHGTQTSFWYRFGLVIGLTLVLLTACGRDETPTPTTATTTQGNTDTPTLVATAANPPALTQPAVTEPPTPAPPTATPEPLAATVNGQPISLATFAAELALMTPPGEDPALYQQMVLDVLIDRTLIALAAATFNITVTPEMVDERILEAQQAANETGGATGYTDWLTANGLTEASFRELVRQEMIAGLVAEQVTSAVPFTAEHVRARYIHVTDQAVAQDLLLQLQNGGDFYTLAQLYSVDSETAQNGGDLDYFSRGTLLIPEIEDAAFSLEIVQTSDIITLTVADGQSRY